MIAPTLTRIRTQDLMITDQTLHQLSYTDTWTKGQNNLLIICSRNIEPVNIERRQHHREFLLIIKVPVGY